MRIEAHDHLGKPIRANITRLIVYDDFDNPVAIAIKHAHGWAYVGHLRDPEFQNCLDLLGVKKVTLYEDLDPKLSEPLIKLPGQ